MKLQIKYSLFLMIFIILLSFSAYLQENNQDTNYKKIKLKMDKSNDFLIVKIPSNDFYYREDYISFKLEKPVYNEDIKTTYIDKFYVNIYVEDEMLSMFLNKKREENFIEKNELPDIKSGKFTFKTYKGIKKEKENESYYFVHSFCDIKDYTYNIFISKEEDFSAEEIKPFMDIEIKKNYLGIIASNKFISMIVALLIIGSLMGYTTVSKVDKKGITTTGKIIDVQKKRLRSSTEITITVKYMDLDGNEVISKATVHRIINEKEFDDKIGQDIEIKYLPNSNFILGEGFDASYNYSTILMSILLAFFLFV